MNLRLTDELEYWKEVSTARKSSLLYRDMLILERNSSSEVKYSMAKIVIVYSQPG